MQTDHQPLSIHDLLRYKQRGEPFVMLTAYDATMAGILDDAGVPVLLVGDSLGMVVLGQQSTVPVTMDDMVHHTAAVRAGTRRAVIVADLPFGSIHVDRATARANAFRLVQQGGATAVKIEGGAAIADLVADLVSAGVPVMGHLGLTPQSVNQLGGYRVQGRDADGADRIVAAARAFEQAGAFALVVEAVPSAVGDAVTAAIDIPTIGIGAGAGTDGQVLVINDLLGLTAGPLPRFVKPYVDGRSVVRDAVKAFQAEVAAGEYPGPEHQY